MVRSARRTETARSPAAGTMAEEAEAAAAPSFLCRPPLWSQLPPPPPPLLEEAAKRRPRNNLINGAVSPLRIRWRWFPIAGVTNTTFPILRSGTSATGFEAGLLPHYYVVDNIGMFPL